MRAEQLAAPPALCAALDRENEERAAHPIRVPLPAFSRSSFAVLPSRRWSGSPLAIYTLMAEGQFPLPIRLTGKAVGWRRNDIDAWLAARPPSRRARLIRQERQASEAP